MERPNIGKLIGGKEGRDAIHIAIAPMEAQERLFPGQDIGIVNGKAAVSPSSIGIVDPFLKGPVYSGQWFYMFLYPNTITSLRHEWEHPAFNATGPESDSVKAAAVLRIQQAADGADVTYSEMIEYARDFAENGEWAVQGGRWEGIWVCDDSFWDAYEIVTGKKVVAVSYLLSQVPVLWRVK